MKNAIVLCSGGLDSVVTAHFVRKDYEKIKILFFNYGQRNCAMERDCAERCASDLSADFFEIDLKYLGEI